MSDFTPPPPPNPFSKSGAASFGGATSSPRGVDVASPWIRLGAFLVESILILVTFGIGWLIWAATIAGSGQTPAKKLLNLRVVSVTTQQPVGFGTMLFMRGIVAGFVAYFAIAFTLGILLFMPFWDKRSQNIWDKVSSTYVVTDPNNAWNL